MAYHLARVLGLTQIPSQAVLPAPRRIDSPCAFLSFYFVHKNFDLTMSFGATALLVSVLSSEAPRS